MEFKIGDKVRIKKDLIAEDTRECNYIIFVNKFFVNKEMTKFAGNTATITQVEEENESYRIDLDEGLWRWTERMFEPLFDEKTTIKMIKEVKTKLENSTENFSKLIKELSLIFKELKENEWLGWAFVIISLSNESSDMLEKLLNNKH